MSTDYTDLIAQKKAQKKRRFFFLLGTVVLVSVGAYLVTSLELSPQTSSTAIKPNLSQNIQHEKKDIASVPKDRTQQQSKPKVEQQKQQQSESIVIEHDGRPRLYSSDTLELKQSIKNRKESKFRTKSVIQQIKKQKNFAAVRRIYLQQEDQITTTSLEELPFPSLLPVLFFLQNHSAGAEWDFIITIAQQRYRTSVVFEPNGDLYTHLSVKHEAKRNTLSPEELTERFSLGPLLSRSVPWKAHDYAILEHALKKLSFDELAVISRMPIVRAQAPEQSNKNGLYSYQNSYAEILLYDRLSDNLDQGYAGTPTQPYNIGEFTMLHEIGHAIVYHPYLVWRTLQEESIDTYNQKTRQLNRNAGKRYSPQDPQYLQSQKDKRDLDELKEKLKQIRETTSDYGDNPPVMSAFLSVRSFTQGPTEYSNESPEEAFAESFAMFHLDPKALQRVDPAVYQWFADGKHIQSMLDALPTNPPKIQYTKE